MSDLETALLKAITAIVDNAVKRAMASRPDELLSTAAAAREAKVGPATIRRWIAKGNLKAHRTGRTLRVRRGELEALLRGSNARNDEASPEELARRQFG